MVLCKLNYKRGSPEEQIFLDQTLELLSEIPGVVSVSAGASYVYEPTGDRSQGYTHGIVVRMKDKEVLDIYTSHPKHVELKNSMIVPRLLEQPGKLCAFDLESVRTKGPASSKENWKLAAVGGWLVAACALGYIFTRHRQ